MSNLIPPMPTGVLPGSSYWNDWIEKLRTLINSLSTGINWTVITGKPTTIAGYGITDPIELTTRKNAANGYAGLDGTSRVTKGVKTTDYVVIDSTTAGLTLKSPNGHYWVSSISNVGAVTWTDVGTTSP